MLVGLVHSDFHHLSKCTSSVIFVDSTFWSYALQFDVHQVVGILLFVLEDEQFICSKRLLFWCTVSLITCPSAPPLLVILLTLCICTVTVDAIVFCLSFY